MLIFHKQNLAYLAVPKTGTTALEAALEPFATAILRDPPGLKHCNARKFDRKFRALFQPPNQRLETVAVIRHPTDWLGSWYRYRQRGFLDGKPRSTKNISFAQFIGAYLDPNPPEYAQTGAQGKFLTDGKGTCLVDHLFAYDRLSEATAFFEDRLGETIILDQRNASPMPDSFSLDLPDDLLARLKNALAVDYALYEGLA